MGECSHQNGSLERCGQLFRDGCTVPSHKTVFFQRANKSKYTIYFRQKCHDKLVKRGLGFCNNGDRIKQSGTGRYKAHGRRNIHTIIKVKHSRYRPGVAQSVPGNKVPRFHDNGTGWW